MEGDVGRTCQSSMEKVSVSLPFCAGGARALGHGEVITAVTAVTAVTRRAYPGDCADMSGPGADGADEAKS